MNVVISGYYGSKNSGDEAMLAAMIKDLQAEIPDLKITVVSLAPNYTRRRHNVDAIPWLNPLLIIKKIYSADLLISGGGSLLQNVTSGRSLYYYLMIILTALIFRKKVMLYAQGIGPIQGSLAKNFTRFVLNHVKLITVRDKGSLEELSNLKVTCPGIFCTADPALSLKPVTTSIGRKILLKYFSECSNNRLIGVAVRYWSNWENFRKQLSISLDKIIEEHTMQVIFIPMKFPEDIQAARSISQLMKRKSFILDDEFTTQEILSLVGCMDILISVRLHALIFASVMNVPMLGISYDPKIDRFLESINEKSLGSFSDITTSEILNGVLRKLSISETQIDNTIHANLSKLSQKNAKLAARLIKFDTYKNLEN